MRRLIFAAAAAAVMSVSAAIAGGPGSAPEPDGLHMGVLQGYTPSTLTGATVVDAAATAELMAKGAVLLDVGPADRKPDTLPDAALWRPQHRTIPTAIWLPGAGFGDLDGTQEAALKARVLALAGGDLDRPVVTFCKPDCWGSWNLGKRLIGWGFRKVNWFPEGVNGWMEADHDTAVVKADPEWAAASAPLATR